MRWSGGTTATASGTTRGGGPLRPPGGHHGSGPRRVPQRGRSSPVEQVSGLVVRAIGGLVRGGLQGGGRRRGAWRAVPLGRGRRRRGHEPCGGGRWRRLRGGPPDRGGPPPWGGADALIPDLGRVLVRQRANTRASPSRPGRDCPRGERIGEPTPGLGPVALGGRPVGRRGAATLGPPSAPPAAVRRVAVDRGPGSGCPGGPGGDRARPAGGCSGSRGRGPAAGGPICGHLPGLLRGRAGLHFHGRGVEPGRGDHAGVLHRRPPGVWGHAGRGGGGGHDAGIQRAPRTHRANHGLTTSKPARGASEFGTSDQPR